MLHFIPGTNKCGITDEFDVTINGELFHCAQNTSVKITILGKLVEKPVQWLYGISQVGYVDMFDVQHLHFTFNPNSRSRFPWFAWYDIPKIVFDEYRVVPGFPNVAVSSTGIAIDAHSGKEFKCVISHNYRYIYCYVNFYRKKIFLPIYKMVALAWIPNHESLTRYVVNHKNPFDVPLNDDVSNLEWTTYSENTEHAVEHGLFPWATVCRIRNAFTGEIKVFPSLASMFEFFGVRYTKGSDYFRRNRCNKLYGKMWEVRICGDERPWVYSNQAQNIEPSRYIIKVTEPDQEAKIFNGVRSVISHYGLQTLPSWSCRTAVERLKEQHPEFVIEVLDQYDTGEIEVKSVDTGVVETYKTITELAVKRGWAKSTIIDCAKCDGKRLYKNNYLIRRKSSNPWPVDYAPPKNVSQKLILTDKHTGKTIQCESVRHAAEFLNRDRDYVRRCIENPKDRDDYVITPASSSNR